MYRIIVYAGVRCTICPCIVRPADYSYKTSLTNPIGRSHTPLGAFQIYSSGSAGYTACSSVNDRISSSFNVFTSLFTNITKTYMYIITINRNDGIACVQYLSG